MDGTTKSAGMRGDEGTGRIFPCEACGADLVFNIGAQRLKCPRCDHEQVIDLSGEPAVREQDFQAMLARLRQQRVGSGARGDRQDRREIKCETCGATINFEGTLTSTECEYCGAPRQKGGVHEAPDRVPVDGVLPFQVEKKQASENLVRWVRSRWFAPNEFLRRGVDGKFSGVYLPYWTFDSMTSTWYTGQRGEHYWVEVGEGDQKRKEMRTRWHPASGSFQRFFDDVMVCASHGLPAKVTVELEPWPLEEVLPYSQQLLAGWLAQTYDLELEAGFGEAKQRIDEAVREETRERIGGDEQRIDRLSTKYDAITYKHLLLPVWILTYRYGETPYRVLVNACTGEVQGERPYSKVKIALAVMFGVLVAVLIWYFTRKH